MGRFLCLNFPFSHCKIVRIFLAVFWISGLLLGCLLSHFTDTHLFSLMLSASDCRMSIVSFLSAQLLPLLFTVLAVYLSRQRILLILALFEGLLFAFVGSGLLSVYGTSAWLLRWLLMFSSSLTLPVYWYLWLCSFSLSRSTWIRLCIPAAVIVLSTGLFDYAVVAPFLAHLISL